MKKKKKNVTLRQERKRSLTSYKNQRKSCIDISMIRRTGAARHRSVKAMDEEQREEERPPHIFLKWQPQFAQHHTRIRSCANLTPRYQKMRLMHRKRGRQVKRANIASAKERQHAPRPRSEAKPTNPFDTEACRLRKPVGTTRLRTLRASAAIARGARPQSFQITFSNSFVTQKLALNITQTKKTMIENSHAHCGRAPRAIAALARSVRRRVHSYEKLRHYFIRKNYAFLSSSARIYISEEKQTNSVLFILVARAPRDCRSRLDFYWQSRSQDSVWRKRRTLCRRAAVAPRYSVGSQRSAAVLLCRASPKNSDCGTWVRSRNRVSTTAGEYLFVDHAAIKSLSLSASPFSRPVRRKPTRTFNESDEANLIDEDRESEETYESVQDHDSNDSVEDDESDEANLIDEDRESEETYESVQDHDSNDSVEDDESDEANLIDEDRESEETYGSVEDDESDEGDEGNYGDEYDSDEVDRLDEKKLEKIESMLSKVDWKIEKERVKFIEDLCPLLRNWNSQLPDLRDIFQKQKIECLFTDSLTCMRQGLNGYELGQRFIKFLAGTGYKDEPDVDEDGKPLVYRTTPVHHAARNEFYNLVVINDLFEVYDRFDVNYIDDLGLTHFHVACNHGRNDIVEKFLEFGQDPNFLVQETGDSPLHLAMFSAAKKKMIELLLRNGANPNLANKDGLTPLHVICDEYGSDGDCAKMLFELSNEKYHPVQFDAQNKLGDTPLHLALRHGNRKMVELLLRNGASPNVANINGSTPLHIICKTDDDVILAEMLFEISDDKHPPVQVDAQDKSGNSPLHLVMDSGYKKLLEFLLKKGADSNMTNLDGFTPLHIISKRLIMFDDNFLELFIKINNEIQHTVQVDAKDKLGRTPLQWAVVNRLPNAVDVLLDHGADLSSFVFPTESHFDEHLNKYFNKFKIVENELKLKITSDTLITVERLEKGGYELDRCDALTIMIFFINHGLFQKSAVLDEYWDVDKKFSIKAKKIMITPSLSLLDLIQLQPKETEDVVTNMNYFKFACNNELWDLFEEFGMACLVHICEKVSRRFFRRWALDSFLELTRYQMPVLCCNIIIDQLMNEDLCHICLVVTDQSSRR
ncbi:unnamed protein product [Trichogramma brassicae]|uniref:Uncharacterized protein n=1 Tax=Trichogramma brassicae TaxID=86971 RepID=A0A6H5J0K0_9HYME|nr:unnamed protein product [Trichogramma brassicae]